MPYLSKCDQVLILEGGKIVKAGPPTELENELGSGGQGKEEEGEARGSAGEKNLEGSETKVHVSLETYRRYFLNHEANYILAPATILLFLLAEFLSAFFFKHLALYDRVKAGQDSQFETTKELWAYTGLILVGYFWSVFLSSASLFLSILLSNQGLHNNMVLILVRSPTSYFDRTPSGQITNNLSNDLNALDSVARLIGMNLLGKGSTVLIMLGSTMQLNPYVIAPGVTAILVNFALAAYCYGIVVSLQVLSMKIKAPLFNPLSEMMNGILQITLFKRKPAFLSNFASQVHSSLKARTNFILASNFFSTFANFASIFLMLFVFVLGVAALTPDNSMFYGVQIVFIFQIGTVAQLVMRAFMNFESCMVNAKRAHAVAALEHEAALETDYDREQGINAEESLHEWPARADLRVQNVYMKYQLGLPYVLKDISFYLKEGEKLGIVGPTGAGKSSIIQMLFRMVEPQKGCTYELGGCDALKMGLHSLRKNIAVLPQVPFLFKGTVRRNIDPFSTKSEAEIQEAIEGAGIKGAIEHVSNH